MDRACENCRFCIYAHSMRGKEEPYCERHSKWIGDTLLCSEWEAVIAPKPLTNADRIRAMTDEELAEWLDNVCKSAYDEGYTKETDEPLMSPYPSTASEWLGWLRQEAKE